MISCPVCNNVSMISEKEAEGLFGIFFECEICFECFETRLINNEIIHKAILPIRDFNGYVIGYEYKDNNNDNT